MDAESTQPAQSADSTDSTETYLKVMAWLHANQKKLMIGAGVAAVIAVVIGVISWQKSVAEADANAQLLEVPLINLHGDRTVPTPPEPFLNVARQYPDTDAGEYAVLLG